MENRGKQKTESFTDLIAWKEGHALVLLIYNVTERFPKEEVFGLTNQIRRAAVSITSNIAEGFSRVGVDDKKKSYAIALGSLTEVQNQILVGRDLRYISSSEFSKIAQQTVTVSKLINGLRKIRHT